MNELEFSLTQIVSLHGQRYKLFFIQHQTGPSINNARSGHFFSEVFSDGTWYQCNDETVTTLKGPTLTSSSVCLTAYVAIEEINLLLSGQSSMTLEQRLQLQEPEESELRDTSKIEFFSENQNRNSEHRYSENRNYNSGNRFHNSGNRNNSSGNQNNPRKSCNRSQPPFKSRKGTSMINSVLGNKMIPCRSGNRGARGA
jgi:hypothetical protein